MSPRFWKKNVNFITKGRRRRSRVQPRPAPSREMLSELLRVFCAVSAKMWVLLLLLLLLILFLLLILLLLLIDQQLTVILLSSAE